VLRSEGDVDEYEEIKRRKFCVKNVYVWHLPTVIFVIVNKNRYFLLNCFICVLFLLDFLLKVKNFEKF
jgi:hypothetical protein